MALASQLHNALRTPLHTLDADGLFEGLVGVEGIAARIALIAHRDDRYGELPYVRHLKHVHLLLHEYSLPLEPKIGAAALLHDVVEDTPVDLALLSDLVPRTVVDIVDRLTDPPAVTREEAKRSSLERISGSDAACRVKWADRLANLEASFELVGVPTRRLVRQTRDIARGRRYLKMYLSEWDAFRVALGPVGPEELWDELVNMHERAAHLLDATEGTNAPA